MSYTPTPRRSFLDRFRSGNPTPSASQRAGSHSALRWVMSASCGLLMCSASIASGATYYVDPAAGKITNAGTADSPWNTLEAVFSANKRFAAGDVIYLRNGYHGSPVVKGANSGNVTIQAADGHTPKVRKLSFNGATQWTVSGLNISPANVSATTYDTGTLVDISSSSSYITLKGNTIRSLTSITGLTESQLGARTGNGVVVSGKYSNILENKIENVKYGIQVSRFGTNSRVAHNTITNFMHDGMHGLASYCKFEYNTVTNNYKVDANHDDGFQSWTGGYDGIPVGGTTIYNVELRGNIFVNHTDPNQPYKTPMQGIGMFDGTYENWVIENNLVVTNMWHGITLSGAKNCRIVNNTVVTNPIPLGSYTPWIQVENHKNGKASTGCIVSNNLVASLKVPNTVGTVTNNIVTTAFNNHFVNYTGFDFDLKSTSSAIGAATTNNAPSTDIDRLPRSVPYDVGAYEYQSGGTQTPPPTTEEPPPTENPPPTETPSGETYRSSTKWLNVPVTKQTGTFQVSFTMTPSAKGIDSVTGLSRAAASGFSDLAPAIRFAPNGIIDARNGGTYQAATQFTYAANVPYKVVMSIDVATRRYSATVARDGQSPVTVASNYAFRTEQASVRELANLALVSVIGNHTVSNVQVTSGTQTPPPSTENPPATETPIAGTYRSNTNWQNVLLPKQAGTFQLSFTMTPSTTGIDCVTGLSRTAASNFNHLAPAIRFAPNGVIDARNGGAYQAAGRLTYAANVPYKVVMTINVATRRYSATVARDGQAPVTIASNYAFRTEQATVSELANVAVVAVKGSHTVSNLQLSATAAK